MRKYRLERGMSRGVSIDKLLFKNTNSAIDQAKVWLKEDPLINKVFIKMIDPDCEYKCIVER